jgi:iron complex transport system substrate-binding protein
VFFEEWDAPLISSIEWVDELIEVAGGATCFPELRSASLAKDRIVAPADVAARDPEIVIASWCGKAVRKRTIYEREGWAQVAAVTSGQVYEVKSTYILQPGPAALTEGVRQLHALIAQATGLEIDPAIAPEKPIDAEARNVGERLAGRAEGAALLGQEGGRGLQPRQTG